MVKCYIINMILFFLNRGRWHGDVIIHQFHLESAQEIKTFWCDVQSLSKLRHENLLLFMGIATQSLTHRIVNSAPRGVSVVNFRSTVKNGKPEHIGYAANNYSHVISFLRK